MSIIDQVNALFMSKRSIGGIIPDVVIEEHSDDDLTITDHPVEQGAAITDHAFKNPATLTMRVGFSNGDLIGSLVAGTLFSGSSNAEDIYQQFLDLQESREPFDVVTGQRSYNNMLIKSISKTTDKDTENCLILNLTMRQIIIVQTAVTELKPVSDQSQPQSTASPQNAGTKQPIVAKSQSALKILFGG